MSLEMYIEGPSLRKLVLDACVEFEVDHGLVLGG